MRLCLLAALLAASVLLDGCSLADQSFSCQPTVGRRLGGDVDLYIRPATRDASGYLHC